MDLTEYKLEEIKEFHFHVYFFQKNEDSVRFALELRDKIIKLVEKGYFQVVPNPRVNMEPRGPHPVGSYSVWCPKEHFHRLFSFFLLHRGNHSVLVHPLTREDVIDHTERAVWMGPSFPVDTSVLKHTKPAIRPQNTHLGLGYSAPEDK